MRGNVIVTLTLPSPIKGEGEQIEDSKPHLQPPNFLKNPSFSNSSNNE